MAMIWTTEQVLSLAPDVSTVKAGRALSMPQKWLSWGCKEQIIWGECQGSGSKPYQTQIDLTEPAFNCTCPSRKFPCKHGIGLLLLVVNQPSAPQSALPQWLIDWTTARAKRAQQRAEKEQNGGKILDPVAQAKRIAQRQHKIDGGLQELDLWLRDLIRHGLAAAQARGYSFWDAPAARMVDAQAPAVAVRLRQMAGIAATGEGWADRLLEQIGRLHLLIKGYQQFEALPTATQADIYTMIGWAQKQEDLQHEPASRDQWLVLGRVIEDDGKQRTQRTWLLGQHSGYTAFILDSAHGSQSLDTSIIPGTCLDADLIFYSGAYPLRALIKERHNLLPLPDTLPGTKTMSDSCAAYAAALACNPWLERFPMLLANVIPAQRGDQWTVRETNATGHSFRLVISSLQGWALAALSGGNPIHLFGESDGKSLLPISVWVNGRLIAV